MIEKNTKNESKYSNRGPVYLGSIPIEDTNLALMEFSEGSVSMEKCLRVMWQRNLKTYACHVKNDDPYDISYIIMEEKIDLFCYLSPIIIYDNLVQLDYIDTKQIIRFAGSKPHIEGTIISLIRDILSGKKNNRKLVEEKIGKPFPDEWIDKSKDKCISLKLH